MSQRGIFICVFYQRIGQTLVPLLVNPHDIEAETIVLFNNFAVSLQEKCKPTNSKNLKYVCF